MGGLQAILKVSKKKSEYSNAGKGDKSRVTDKKKYDDNWEKIFGDKQPKFKKKYDKKG